MSISTLRRNKVLNTITLLYFGGGLTSAGSASRLQG